ncbi:hypothetical protein BDW74DRAFT_160758 [Aspergillus multicolor]|uniref:uncharacterized protein n=1 Tax=Aspergillus multicolor TaxID=41759 RepID=UPI003CCDCB69
MHRIISFESQHEAKLLDSIPFLLCNPSQQPDSVYPRGQPRRSKRQQQTTAPRPNPPLSQVLYAVGVTELLDYRQISFFLRSNG